MRIVFNIIGKSEVKWSEVQYTVTLKKSTMQIYQYVHSSDDPWEYYVNIYRAVMESN